MRAAWAATGVALVLILAAQVAPPAAAQVSDSGAGHAESPVSVLDTESLRPAQEAEDRSAESPDAVPSVAPGAKSSDEVEALLTIRLAPKSLEVRGNLDDSALRSDLRAAVRAAYPDLPVTTISDDAVAAADGETVARATAALALLRFLANGEAAIHPDRIVLRGAAYHAAAQQALADAAAAADTGGAEVVIDEVTAGHAGPPRPATACEADVAALMRLTPIEFDAGRATLAGDLREMIDRIVFALSACPASLVAVAGHTDSDGTDESNYRLSLARARTVIDMIVAAGLPADRFTPLGYGESRPLASNATERGKAINRRIEFKLRD